jgi:ribulose-phosphate 3-epimerase
MLKVIPVILTNNPSELKSMLGQLEETIDVVQIDIIDGIFANNKTIDPKNLEYIETNLNIDFHLQTKEPINWVESCAHAQAFRITANIEMMTSQREFVQKVQSVGCKVGLGLNYETPLHAIDRSILMDLDVVLLMSIHEVGFGGKPFQKGIFEKIEALNEIRMKDKTPFAICIDGGVNADVVGKLGSLGVDEVVVGRRLFRGNIKGNIEELERLAQ